MKNLFYFFIPIITYLLISCQNEKTSETQTTENETITKIVNSNNSIPSSNQVSENKEVNSTKIDFSHKHYKGKIDKYEITIDLFKNDDKLFGSYYYNSQYIPIKIKGKLNDNKFLLNESADIQNITAKLTGSFANSSSASGEWIDLKTGKKLSFSIEEENNPVVLCQLISNRDSVSNNHENQQTHAFYTTNIIFPVNNDKLYSDLLKNINEKLFGNQGSTDNIENILAKDRGAFFQSFLSNPPSETGAGEWENSITSDLLINDNNLFSMILSNYNYSGGAHPNFSTFYFNFDHANNEIITLKQLLKDPKSKRISELLTKKAKEKFEVPANETLSSAGFYDEILYPAENFYFTTKGITFFYNTDNVASFALGEIEIQLTYKELGKELKYNALK